MKQETSLEAFLRERLAVHLSSHDEQSYMSQEVSEAFVTALVEWKKNILEETKKTMDNLKGQDLAASDVSDQATQEESFSFYLKERDRERKLLKKIDEALVMLENQEYGYCRACGVEIGYERLLARLTATMCIDCKSAQEHMEKHKSS